MIDQLDIEGEDIMVVIGICQRTRIANEGRKSADLVSFYRIAVCFQSTEKTRLREGFLIVDRDIDNAFYLSICLCETVASGISYLKYIPSKPQSAMPKAVKGPCNTVP